MLSNCNTHNCCFKGIDLVVKCYDPQPDFIDFKIPTWWFNVCTGKLYLLKGIDDDGKAIWIEITPGGAGGDGIQKILTQCGIVDADASGKITHTGECGARIVAAECKDFCITVNTAWGLEGGKNVCAGESITIGIDKENTNLVTSSSLDAKDGDSVVYDGTNGKVIKKAQQWRIGDSTNSWTGKYDAESKNLYIFPNDKSDNPILSMLPNGIMIANNQPKASARLTKTTPIFPALSWFQVGSNLAFEKLRDEDGYNKSSNNLYLGNGSGKGAFYTFKYTGIWCVQFQFLLDIGIEKSATLVEYRLTWGKEGSYLSLREQYSITKKIQSLSTCRLLPVTQGDICFVELQVRSSDPNIKPFLYSENDLRSIDNYIGFLLIAG